MINIVGKSREGADAGAGAGADAATGPVAASA